MFTFLKRVLFPERCLGCLTWDTVLCGDCARRMLAPGYLSGSTPSSGAADTAVGTGGRGDGIAFPIAPLTSLSWLMSYELEPVRILIQQLKFHGVQGVVKKIHYDVPPALPAQFKQSSSGSTVLIPIPLHPVRLRERGFNQSLLIAREIAARYDVPVLDSYLQRVKNTLPQSSLSHEQRPVNISGAFIMRRPLPRHVKHVILVDDVWTTGSTIKEAAQVLVSSFGYSVSGLVIAYAGDSRRGV